jgi:CPA1 family monovalent cation:H+ antiporter
MSYLELSGAATPGTRIRRNVIRDALQFTLNGTMFVLLGEQLPDIARGALRPHGGEPYDPWWLAGRALALSLGLVLLRFVWVWISLRLTILNRKRLGRQAFEPRLRVMLTTSVAGVRGALTMAGVPTLPLALPDGSPFPARNLAIFLASSVIVFSLLLASAALPALLRGLTMPDEPQAQCDEDDARDAATLAAIAALETLRDGDGRRRQPRRRAGAATRGARGPAAGAQRRARRRAAPRPPHGRPGRDGAQAAAPDRPAGSALPAGLGGAGPTRPA